MLLLTTENDSGGSSHNSKEGWVNWLVASCICHFCFGLFFCGFNWREERKIRLVFLNTVFFQIVNNYSNWKQTGKSNRLFFFSISFLIFYYFFWAELISHTHFTKLKNYFLNSSWLALTLDVILNKLMKKCNRKLMWHMRMTWKFKRISVIGWFWLQPASTANHSQSFKSSCDVFYTNAFKFLEYPEKTDFSGSFRIASLVFFLIAWFSWK